MKLKLQFWKTPYKLSCCLLDYDDLPDVSTVSVKVAHDYNDVHLYLDEIRFGVQDNFGRVGEIYHCDQRSLIDFYVKAITKELFTPKKREVKVGGIVKIKGEREEYKVVHILPEKYSNRYILTQNVNFHGNVLWIYADKVIPIKPQLKFTKEITDSIETYTWEI